MPDNVARTLGNAAPTWYRRAHPGYRARTTVGGARTPGCGTHTRSGTTEAGVEACTIVALHSTHMPEGVCGHTVGTVLELNSTKVSSFYISGVATFFISL